MRRIRIVVIADAGGGTIDVSSFRVTCLKPLEVEEVRPPSYKLIVLPTWTLVYTGPLSPGAFAGFLLNSTPGPRKTQSFWIWVGVSEPQARMPTTDHSSATGGFGQRQASSICALLRQMGFLQRSWWKYLGGVMGITNSKSTSLSLWVQRE